MSEKPAKPAIPSWQRATPLASPPSPGAEDSTKDDTQTATESQEEEPRDEDATSESPHLLDQASKFLEDPSIRDAPRDRKAAFLESKGVTKENIEKLLGVAEEQKASPSVANKGEQPWPKTSTPPKSPPREIPPIVTYPEFLTQSTKPPPLITARRIATTAYVAGAVATAIYGISKYIVSPMTETLTDARHDFASHAQIHVEEFNTKLGDIVSVDPATTSKLLKPTGHGDDISEADSDPTELYHRDFGTQTTPSLSRRPSVSSNTASDPEANTTVAIHETRLKSLTSHLRELEATHNNDTSSAGSLRASLTELNTYLSEMTYQSYHSYGGGMYGGSNYGMPRGKDGKEDQVEALKAEIRGVKGVLLSARNFPAGGGRIPVGN
ncbi:uncharacterized protein BDZ99DRAFT_468127 [Mytilinidion resinicola]|uniref:Peroxisomal membrane protein PEX14 n=1 Tax=Mytilinidion resinicola TaxID=574789 RepID=A0A6A6Y6F3_9PEZI|nr:uncharacterized protein BDZ99DRAFT_468127 [Mytilinidion resinicola]KAF2803594.1 hypothetical protein BDZ99DRAFT_468127 [Mytilinidion resinicola]